MDKAMIETDGAVRDTLGLGRRKRGELAFAFAVAVIALLIGIRYHGGLWALDENGMSRLSSKLPYWDFTNLWAGTRMALDGHVGWLFDVDAYRQALRAMFTPLLPAQEWSYPPSILLIGAPLGMMPIFSAYLVWTVGTIAALHFSLRPLGLSPLAQLLVVFSPVVMLSALFGQNGALTAALLFAALALSTERPLLAGVFAGLLSVKPHLGILIPFAYLASGNWRAFLSAALTAIAMIMVTAVLFGAEAWPLFLEKTAPLMASILEAPYPQLYHANAMTFFIFGRWLGLSVTASYLLQGLFSLLAIAVTIWLWHRKSAVPLQMRVVMTALLTICATPYGYSYDAVPYSVAVAWLFLTAASPNRYIFGALWIFPYFADMPNFYGYGVSILVPAGLAIYGIRQVLISQRESRIKVS
jgi:hypothetical protein